MSAQTPTAPVPVAQGLGPSELLEMYRFMRLTRSLEERLVVLFRQSKVVGGLFRSLGQEGESVATAFALRRRTDGSGDLLSPLIRNLGSMLVMGATPLEVLRQYLAKGDSPTRGKELNIHFSDYDRGFLGQISPLGSMVPVMAGVTRCSAVPWWWWSRTRATPIRRPRDCRPRPARSSTRRPDTARPESRWMETTCWRRMPPPGGPWTGRGQGRE